MNNDVNFAARGWDDDMERYCVCWQSQAICHADAWNQFANATTGAEDNDIVLMVALHDHTTTGRRAIVTTTIDWEGP